MKRSFWARRILFLIPIAAFAILVFGGIVMLLWNNVLAVVLNISTISFVQALGILVLSKILFSSFGGGGYSRRNYFWKRRMQEKWATMTPEEKERFKEQWNDRCGRWGYKSWDSESASSQKSTEPQ